MTEILGPLAGAHATLVGVIAAFFSAFAAYAYQQLQETRDALDRVIREVGEYRSSRIYIANQGERAYLKDGELDWSGFRDVIRDASGIFRRIEVDAQPSPWPSTYSRTPAPDTILSTTRVLCSLFHYFFVSYPFWGKSNIHVEGISDRLEDRKLEHPNLDGARLREVERRIRYLSWIWSNEKHFLVQLGQAASRFDAETAARETKERFDKSMELMPGMSPEGRAELWQRTQQPYPTDYAGLIIEFFDMIGVWQERILPKTQAALEAYTTYNTRFKVKKATMWVLTLVGFNTSFGIFLPLALLASGWDGPAAMLTGYALTVVTMAPYFVGLWYLHNLVSSSAFE